jgi:hypothetical protein
MSLQTINVRLARVRNFARRWRHHHKNKSRADALAELVEARLPMEFTVTVTATGDADAWPLVGTALLSRMTTTLRRMFDATHGGQSVDAATLARSLYEHVVHFAWLAADPSTARIQEWFKADLISRLKADTDMRSLGEPLFSDADRAALESQIAAMKGPKELKLVNLAIAADKHWAGKLPGMGAHTTRDSFKGLYAVLYRSYSSTAHPTYMGLNHVVEDTSPTGRRVVIEKPPEGRGPFGFATVVYALGLYVAAQSLGWPEADAVTAAFDRYPARP